MYLAKVLKRKVSFVARLLAASVASLFIGLGLYATVCYLAQSSLLKMVAQHNSPWFVILYSVSLSGALGVTAYAVARFINDCILAKLTYPLGDDLIEDLE